jgi:hypothetical protein
VTIFKRLVNRITNPNSMPNHLNYDSVITVVILCISHIIHINVHVVMQHHIVCSFTDSEMAAGASGIHLEIIVFSTHTCIVELKMKSMARFCCVI